MSGDARGVDYPVRRLLQTRWNDNDSNGHLNNAVYIELFDTLVNTWLAEHGTDVRHIPVVAETHCRYLRELAFPAPVTGLLSIARLGRTSITYDLALVDHEEQVAAECRWVHVYIDRENRRPVPLPSHVQVGASTL